MTEKTLDPRADAQGEKLDAILKAVAGLIARVDEMEKNLPAPPLVTAADKKAKHDDDEDDRADDDEDDRKDAEGSDPVEHGKAGEIKPDDEGEMEDKGHIKFKSDDDEDDDDEAFIVVVTASPIEEKVARNVVCVSTFENKK